MSGYNQRDLHDCRQRATMDILNKNEKVGDYIPDVIAYERIVVDAKVIEKYHRPRNWSDDELSEGQRASAGSHPKLQARKAGMETVRPMNLSVSISVHQWLKIKRQQIASGNG